MSLEKELTEYHELTATAIAVLDKDLRQLEETTESLKVTIKELDESTKNMYSTFLAIKIIVAISLIFAISSFFMVVFS